MLALENIKQRSDGAGGVAGIQAFPSGRQVFAFALDVAPVALLVATLQLGADGGLSLSDESLRLSRALAPLLVAVAGLDLRLDDRERAADLTGQRLELRER